MSRLKIASKDKTQQLSTFNPPDPTNTNSTKQTNKQTSAAFLPCHHPNPRKNFEGGRGRGGKETKGFKDGQLTDRPRLLAFSKTSPLMRDGSGGGLKGWTGSR